MIPKHSYVLFSKDEIQSDINLITLECKNKYGVDWPKVFHKRIRGHFIDKIKDYYNTRHNQLYIDLPIEEPNQHQELLDLFRNIRPSVLSLLTEFFEDKITYEHLIEKSPYNKMSTDFILKEIYAHKSSQF